MYVGFKRLHVGVFDKDETKVIKKMLWEGQKGGTVNMNITGLAPDVIKVFASDGAVWTAKKGTGDVKADVELFNVPHEDINEVLGLDVEGGEAWAGTDTQAPYIAVIGETADDDGNPILIALPKGTATLDSIQLSTLEEKAKVPENDKLSISCVNAKIDGKERVYGKYVATSSDDAGVQAFMDKIFVGYTPEQVPAG